MARDRKRGKRQTRRTREGEPVTPSNGPLRSNLPGSLGHASGDVDEFDAALVRGADGVPVDPEPKGAPGPDEPTADEPGQQDLVQPPAPLAGPPGSSGGEEPSAGDGSPQDGSAEDLDEDGSDAGEELDRISRRAAGISRAPEPRGGLRAVAFLRASWAELHRVQWPDRHQVTQATAVVLGFVAVAGAYLGLADLVAKAIVEAIL